MNPPTTQKAKAWVLVALVLAIMLLVGCADAALPFAFDPPLAVTPASAPVDIPGVVAPVQAAADTTPTATAEAAPEASADATAAEPTEEAPTATPAATPTPARTPIRIRVPASPPELTPTPTSTATSEPTPTQTPSPTVGAPTVTATPFVITATPTPGGVGLAETFPAESEDLEDEAGEDAEVAMPVLRAPGLDNTLNILVAGSDERSEGHAWRADVIMVVAVDFATREVGVISFPRDLWVRIPTVGENRINTATFWGHTNRYRNGGAIGLLADTITQNFGIRIDHYVKINFQSFEDLIDALGGITVVVDCPITGNFPREPGSKQLVRRTLQPGEYHMDGVFALRYVRERKSTNDIDRNRRQQRVLVAVRNRAREVNIIPRLPALYDALRQTIDTDLGLTNIIALARLGVLIEPEQAHGFTIGFQHTRSWTTPAGAAVLLPRMDLIQREIARLFEHPSILENPNRPRTCPDD